MLIVISPAKRLDFESTSSIYESSEIRFPEVSKMLNDALRNYSPGELAHLQKLSKALAELNVYRNLKWQWPFDKEESKQALFAFNGDVYDGLNASTLAGKDVKYAQSSLRILSGLYGLLRPLDEILPYRLEMGTKLKSNGGDNLYQVWKDKLTDLLVKDMQDENKNILLNLASQEYFKTIDLSKVDAEVITPSFKDYKNGTYKVVSFYAKKARGLMTRFVIENQLSDKESLKAFNEDGYFYNSELSDEKEFVFTRN